MFKRFNPFGNNPQAAKERERMQRRKQELEGKQLQASRVIEQNASRGRFEDTSHIFSRQDREELASFNRQMGGKRRRTQRRKGRKARKTHRRRVSKTHRRKGRKGRKVRKGRKARKTHRRKR
tara:strand:+ start:355 stop:720 length:366 start_codon:yes stop_codon:yes gene_type:complete